MLIENIHIRGVRSLRDLSLDFAPNINLITGPNGQGKTSILESLWLICTLRSFRTHKLQELISTDEKKATVSAKLSYPELFTRNNEVQLELGHHSKLKKSAFLNQKIVSKRSQFVHLNLGTESYGQPCVVFHPADHRLIDGEPALRRNYLDQMLFQLEPEYATRYLRYQRALNQRNALFRGEKTPLTKAQAAGFLELLIEDGAHLLTHRKNWEKRLIPAVCQNLSQTLGMPADLKIEWKYSIAKDAQNRAIFDRLNDSNDVESMRSFWKEKQSEISEIEWDLKSTLLGPHRDDFSISFNERPLREMGSQGEKRTVILGMKLGEVSLFMSQNHSQKPVLLVDDFSSELDQEKRTKFLEYMQESSLQVFITGTEAILGVGHSIRLNRGKAW